MVDRNSRLRWAAGASIVSKIGNFLLQIVVVPLAIRRLGPERFGIYATVVSIFGFLSLADFGFGPGIVRKVAGARVSGVVKEAKETIGAAIVTVGLSVVGMGTVVLGLVWILPVEVLLGSKFEPFQADMRSAATVGMSFVVIQMVASVIGRAQAGCQEMHVSNLVGAAGSVLGAGAVSFILLIDYVTIVSLLVAVAGSTCLAAVGNSVIFLFRHPELRPSFVAPRLRRFREFLVDSFGFWVAGSIVPLIQREGARLLVARIDGPAEVGRLSVLQQAGMYVAGLVIIYTGPLFPAIADAWGESDFKWLSRARGRSYVLWGVVASAMVIGGVLVGPELIQLWVGNEFEFTRIEMLSYAVFMALILWSHIHFVFLGSTGRSTVVARVVFGEALLGLGFSAIIVPHFGLLGLFAAMSLAGVLTSAWILPRIADSQMRWRQV